MSMRMLNVEAHLVGRFGNLVLLNKPPDWPTSGHHLEDPDCIQFHLMAWFGQMVWTLHQLDADTSGACLFSLDRKLVGKVQQLWNQPEMEKVYLALVHGEPGWESMECRQPIGMVDDVSLGITQDGKAAHSHFQVLSRKNGYSMIRARIYTGRTHQIRIHLSSLGHPLIGEEWYRNPACRLHPRQALHALMLRFPSNALMSSTTYTAPLAEDLIQLAAGLGLDLAEVEHPDEP